MKVLLHLPSLKQMHTGSESFTQSQTDDKYGDITYDARTPHKDWKYIKDLSQRHCPASYEYPSEYAEYSESPVSRRYPDLKDIDQITQNASERRTVLIEEDLIRRVRPVCKIRDHSQFHNKRKKAARHGDPSVSSGYHFHTASSVSPSA